MTYDSALRKRIAPDSASWCSVRSIYIGAKCENVQEMKKNVTSSSSFPHIFPHARGSSHAADHATASDAVHPHTLCVQLGDGRDDKATVGTFSRQQLPHTELLKRVQLQTLGWIMCNNIILIVRNIRIHCVYIVYSTLLYIVGTVPTHQACVIMIVCSQ